jgi:large subunit ribosomal protein L12
LDLQQKKQLHLWYKKLITKQKLLKPSFQLKNKMEILYAAMLLHKAGKQIDEASIEAVLKAAGITPDKALIKATVTALKDIDIDKTIKEAIAVPTAVAPQAAAATPAAPAQKKEEEKKTEEEAAAGLGALFD